MLNQMQKEQRAATAKHIKDAISDSKYNANDIARKLWPEVKSYKSKINGILNGWSRMPKELIDLCEKLKII